MPAPSLTLLGDRLGEVTCLVGVCRSRRSRRARNTGSEEPALLRGALVLLCSHVEGFFEELVGDVVTAIDAGVQVVGDIPEAIRVRQVLGEPGRWTAPDQQRRWALVRECAQSPLFNDADAHVPGALDPGLHTDGFANPGTGAIQDLFKTVGLADCWVNFQGLEPRLAYKNEIDAIVARRNQIAHGDMNAIVTDADILSYVQNFRHTAGVFAQLAERHVAAHVPDFAW